MKDLVALMEGHGCRNVRTYIQSGNVVFETDQPADLRLARAFASDVRARHGFEPHFVLLTPNELEQAIAANPFPAAEENPKALHLAFLDAVPVAPNLEKLDGLRAESEEFRLFEKRFYLHAPEGVGRSKLAANMEAALGVSLTSRDWRTITKVLTMAEEG